MLVAENLGSGTQFDQFVLAARGQENSVKVTAMYDCIGVAKAVPKWLVERHADDFLGRHSIHEPKIVDVDCDGACGIADAELVKRVKGVRAELNTGADLSEFWCPFKYDASDAFPGKGECSGYAANTTTGDNKWLVLGHRRFLSAAMGMFARVDKHAKCFSRRNFRSHAAATAHALSSCEAGRKQCCLVPAFSSVSAPQS